MSRIGKRKLTIPEGVIATVSGRTVQIKGPKGELAVVLPLGVVAEVGGSSITTGPESKDKEKFLSPFLGLANALINNALLGVKEGFSKKLELSGVGYRAKRTEKGISMTLGFSHPVDFEVPVGITVDVEDNTKITVSGIDKQLVGLVCAKIRELKKPEPYKGKGIRYATEVVRRKAGKAGKVQK